MRTLIFLAAAFAATVPLRAERVFRASSIDIEQNERLDDVEARVGALESSVALGLKAQKMSLEPVPDPKPKADPDPVTVTNTPDPPKKVVVRIRPASPAQTTGRLSAEELRSLIRAAAPGGWTGPRYADVSPRSMAKEHLVGAEHGFTWDQVAGLTQEEALILHDFAPGHGNRIFPTRSRQPARQTTVTAAATPVAPSQVTQQQNMGCANGQCATPSSGTVQRGGNFPIFRRLFR